MDPEQEARQTPETPDAPPRRVHHTAEDNVVSVWHGTGNTAWFRKRWFEGYTFYETLEENGKKVMHNVYTGYWYTQELDKRGRWKHRVAYLFLLLLALGLMLFASTRCIDGTASGRTIAANGTLGAIPAFAAMAGCCWALFGVVNDFIVPQKRTIGDYRATSLAIRRGSLMAAIGAGVYLLAALIFGLLNRDQLGMHLLCAGAALVACALALLALFYEKKVKYTETLSDYAGVYTM